MRLKQAEIQSYEYCRSMYSSCLFMLFMSFGVVISFRADVFWSCNLSSSENVINLSGCNCRNSLGSAGVSNPRDDGHFGLQSCSSLVQASSEKIPRVAEVELPKSYSSAA
jgi:hypothetical protein